MDWSVSSNTKRFNFLSQTSRTSSSLTRVSVQIISCFLTSDLRVCLLGAVESWRLTLTYLNDNGGRLRYETFWHHSTVFFFFFSLSSRLRVNLSDLNHDAEAETLNFNLICPQRTIGSATRHKNSARKIKLTKWKNEKSLLIGRFDRLSSFTWVISNTCRRSVSVLGCWSWS